MGSRCVKRRSSKKSRGFKMQPPLPQGFFPPEASLNSIDQDPKYSSPYGAFFAQFAYKPDRRRDGNSPPLPNTVDHPVRLPPQGHPLSGSSHLTAKETSKPAIAKTTTSNTKQPCPASASTSGSQEEATIKGKENPENKMTREMSVRESPRPMANPEYKSNSPVLVTPETLSSAQMIPMAVREAKERERKNQEVLLASPLMEEPVRKEEKKHKKRKNGEDAVLIPSPPAASVAQILQMESKLTAGGATVRKKHRPQKVEHEQSGQPPFPIDVHPQAGEETATSGVMGSRCVKRSSSKKSQVLKKQLPLPQGFFPPMASPNSIDQDSNYSSPFGGFFAQFAYKPDRRQDGNGPPLPNTADRPARLPRGHPSSGSSLLTTKETLKAARTTTSNTKQPCPASASTSGSQEEARIKGKGNPENKMTREMSVRESPRPLANPEYKSDSPVLLTPETQSSVEMIPMAVREVKEGERKNQKALLSSPLMEEPARKEEKKNKKRKNGEDAVMIPSPPAAAVAQILQMESKVMAGGATVRKKLCRQKMQHERCGQPPFPIDVHPQAGEEAAGSGGVMGSQCVKRSSSKKSQVLKKQLPLPQGFFPPMANPKSIDQDPKYSSPFGAFFAQFAYKPDRRQDGSGPTLPNTADRPAKLPRGHPSSGSFLLTTKETLKAARTTTSNTKQPCPASASASTSGSQEGVRVKGKEKPEKMTREKKPRERSPLLRAAEKRSDQYRRLSLDQLVSPPRSPHELLQENYASDPWKVIVICILLNLTQGKQVRKKVEGFFKRYPDPQTAYTADLEKMAEYLAPLGLQRVKAKRIQKFSKAYVGEEWTYITELCGVGKYAADAYAIFCAGRANEVIPKDHKLVDYWSYICFELPSIRAGVSRNRKGFSITYELHYTKSQDAQEAGVMELENLVAKMQEVALSC